MHINGMGAESGFYTASSLEIKTERRVCIMYVCMYVCVCFFFSHLGGISFERFH